MSNLEDSEKIIAEAEDALRSAGTAEERKAAFLARQNKRGQSIDQQSEPPADQTPAPEAIPTLIPEKAPASAEPQPKPEAEDVIKEKKLVDHFENITEEEVQKKKSLADLLELLEDRTPKDILESNPSYIGIQELIQKLTETDSREAAQKLDEEKILTDQSGFVSAISKEKGLQDRAIMLAQNQLEEIIKRFSIGSEEKKGVDVASPSDTFTGYFEVDPDKEIRAVGNIDNLQTLLAIKSENATAIQNIIDAIREPDSDKESLIKKKLSPLLKIKDGIAKRIQEVQKLEATRAELAAKPAVTIENVESSKPAEPQFEILPPETKREMPLHPSEQAVAGEVIDIDAIETPAKQKIHEKTDMKVQANIDKKLASLGLTREMLDTVVDKDGKPYNLSSGQTLQLLDQFGNQMFFHIQAEAKQKHEEHVAKSGKGVLGKLSSIGKNFFKQKKLKNREAKIAADILNSANEPYTELKRNTLSDLMRTISNSGLEVKVVGERLDQYTVQYLKPERNTKGIIDTEAVERFNVAATNFARLPVEKDIKMLRLSKEERKAYYQAKKEYKDARAAISMQEMRIAQTKFAGEVTKIQNSKTLSRRQKRVYIKELYDAVALTEINTIDGRVMLSQFNNFHPSIEGRLDQMATGPGFMENVAAYLGKRNAGDAATMIGIGLGAWGAKSALKGAALFNPATAAVTGAVIGGTRGFVRARSVLRDEEFDQRMGTHKESAKVLKIKAKIAERSEEWRNINTYINLLHQEKAKGKISAKEAKKQQKEYEAIQKDLSREIGSLRDKITTKNFIDIGKDHGYIQKIQDLTDLINTPYEDFIKSEENQRLAEIFRKRENRQRLRAWKKSKDNRDPDLIESFDEQTYELMKIEWMRKLDSRVEFTEKKIADGLVNLGDENNRIDNQFELTQALSNAKVNILSQFIVNADEWKDGQREKEYIRDKFKKKENEVTWRRFKYVAKTMGWYAVGGVTFAEIGYHIPWLKEHFSSLPKIIREAIFEHANIQASHAVTAHEVAQSLQPPTAATHDPEFIANIQRKIMGYNKASNLTEWNQKYDPDLHKQELFDERYRFENSMYGKPMDTQDVHADIADPAHPFDASQAAPTESIDQPVAATHDPEFIANIQRKIASQDTASNITEWNQHHNPDLHQQEIFDERYRFENSMYGKPVDTTEVKAVIADPTNHIDAAQAAPTPDSATEHVAAPAEKLFSKTYGTINEKQSYEGASRDFLAHFLLEKKKVANITEGFEQADKIIDRNPKFPHDTEGSKRAFFKEVFKEYGGKEPIRHKHDILHFTETPDGGIRLEKNPFDTAKNAFHSFTVHENVHTDLPKQLSKPGIAKDSGFTGDPKNPLELQKWTHGQADHIIEQNPELKHVIHHPGNELVVKRVVTPSGNRWDAEWVQAKGKLPPDFPKHIRDTFYHGEHYKGKGLKPDVSADTHVPAPVSETVNNSPVGVESSPSLQGLNPTVAENLVNYTTTKNESLPGALVEIFSRDPQWPRMNSTQKGLVIWESLRDAASKSTGDWQALGIPSTGDPFAIAKGSTLHLEHLFEGTDAKGNNIKSLAEILNGVRTNAIRPGPTMQREMSFLGSENGFARFIKEIDKPEYDTTLVSGKDAGGQIQMATLTNILKKLVNGRN